MEFFIVMMSVPLFLMILLLFALFVLPHYPRHKQAHSAPSTVNVPNAQGSPPFGSAPDTYIGPTNIVGLGLTILLFAPFVVAMISELKLHKEN